MLKKKIIKLLVCIVPIKKYRKKLRKSLLNSDNVKFNSSKYWNDRYKHGGNSGSGSYNRLAIFKSEVINDFVKNNNIETVVEFGAGDGNNLSLYSIKKYVGLDVSKKAIEILKSKFKDDNDKSFFLVDDFKKKSKREKFDLVLSLDVIYHLIEDEVFENYMTDLFDNSKKYVMIYASNKNEELAIHVKHRKFTDWIDNNAKDWELDTFIKNKYPHDEKDVDNTSFADFYIYKKAI